MVHKIYKSRFCNKSYIFFLLFSISLLKAQLPMPDHIVILMFQNKDYSQIVGSPDAPYINSLLADSNTAHFTQSYGLTHPSQPNYLMLYSGSSHAVTTDAIPTNTPYTTCNLGASLLAQGLTFAGYSESMPSVGYLGNGTTLYARKHNPWSNWQGTLTNNIPSTANQPFANFPTNYNELPDVSFVIPNLINCMHDGTIKQGDSWFKTHLDSFVKWTKKNNSLLICTFDEDGRNESNRILTFFLGPMVKGGIYNNKVTHYNVLSTIEAIYNLPKCGSSAINNPITQVWKLGPVGLNESSNPNTGLKIYPVPAKDQITVNISYDDPLGNVDISLFDVQGRHTFMKTIDLKKGENQIYLPLTDLAPGMYFIAITGSRLSLKKKILVYQASE